MKNFFILLLIRIVCGNHFYGGTLSWSPENNDTAEINDTLTIIIEQRYAWSRNTTTSACTLTTILSHGLIGDISNKLLTCLSPSTICSRSNFTANISSLVPCTDYNTMLDISFGRSQTWVDFNVLSDGLIIGYTSSIDGWIPLQLGGGHWSLIMYHNLQIRSDNGRVNHSPTSTMPLVSYVTIIKNKIISINIPMNDIDGDIIQCRFAKTFNTLGGIGVNECDGACSTIALPSSVQLFSINNTCILNVNLSSAGAYAVAIQLEDFLQNSTDILSSVPLQFILIAIDTTNSSDNCTHSPSIIDIKPNFPLHNSTIIVEMNVPYTFIVIAQIGCLNSTITNFITSSPHGMLKSDQIYTLTSSSFAINHTWTPTSDQLYQTFIFCTIVIDNNYFSSSQYCFNLFVDYQTEVTSNQSITFDPRSANEVSMIQETSESLITTEIGSIETTITTSSTTVSTTTVTTTTKTTVTTTSKTTATTTTTTTSVTSVTTTTTTTMTTTTVTSTTATTSNAISLVLGLGLGLGLSLLILIGILASCCLCKCCLGPLKFILRIRHGDRTEEILSKKTTFTSRKIIDSSKSEISKSRNNYQLKNFNEVTDDSSHWLSTPNQERNTSLLDNSNNEDQYAPFELGPWTTTTTSFLSPSMNSLPTDRVTQREAPPLAPPTPMQQHGSILVEAYSKQQQQIENAT